MRIMIFVAIAMLGGCAAITKDGGQGAAAGQASYQLTHTAQDGSSCTVGIVSGREFTAADIEIGADCSLTAHAEALTGAAQQDRALGLAEQALKRLPVPTP